MNAKGLANQQDTLVSSGKCGLNVLVMMRTSHMLQNTTSPMINEDADITDLVLYPNFPFRKTGCFWSQMQFTCFFEFPVSSVNDCHTEYKFSNHFYEDLRYPLTASFLLSSSKQKPGTENIQTMSTWTKNLPICCPNLKTPTNAHVATLRASSAHAALAAITQACKCRRKTTVLLYVVCTTSHYLICLLEQMLNLVSSQWSTEWDEHVSLCPTQLDKSSFVHFDSHPLVIRQ